MCIRDRFHVEQWEKKKCFTWSSSKRKPKKNTSKNSNDQCARGTDIEPKDFSMDVKIWNPDLLRPKRVFHVEQVRDVFFKIVSRGTFFCSKFLIRVIPRAVKKKMIIDQNSPLSPSWEGHLADFMVCADMNVWSVEPPFSRNWDVLFVLLVWNMSEKNRLCVERVVPRGTDAEDLLLWRKINTTKNVPRGIMIYPANTMKWDFLLFEKRFLEHHFKYQRVLFRSAWHREFFMKTWEYFSTWNNFPLLMSKNLSFLHSGKKQEAGSYWEYPACPLGKGFQ